MAKGATDSDIDLLCVYDEKKLSPCDTYKRLRPLLADLHSRFGSPVHPVLLSIAEEDEMGFIKTEHCIPVVHQDP